MKEKCEEKQKESEDIWGGFSVIHGRSTESNENLPRE